MSIPLWRASVGLVLGILLASSAQAITADDSQSSVSSVDWRNDPDFDVVIVWTGEQQQISDLAALLKKMNLVVLKEYPSSALVSVHKEDKERLKAQGYDVTEIRDRTITGRGACYIDTRKGDGSIPEELRIDPTKFPEYDLFIIQFVGPADLDWLESVEDVGVDFMHYLPRNAYLARMSGDCRELVTRLPFVQWVGVYHPAYKMSPALAHLDDTGLCGIRIHLLPGTDVAEVTSAVTDYGGEVLDCGSVLSEFQVSARASRVTAERIAFLSDVYWIERDRDEYEVFNDRATAVVQSRSEGYRPMFDRGLTGEGQLVAYADTGLEWAHEMFYEDMTDIGFDHRKVVSYAAYGSGTLGDEPWDGHGTHVAGTILGDAPDGDLYGTYNAYDGHAFEARLVAQDICGYDYWGNLVFAPPDDLATMFNPAYYSGARVHTNSWGKPPERLDPAPPYPNEARQLDDFMWSHQDFLLIFAVGNRMKYFDYYNYHISYQSEAKNTISVGATGNGALDWSDIAEFSCQGPTADGRIKPTLCAPGVDVVSADRHDPHGYYPMPGTSMSAPCIAGCAALVRQYFVQGWYPYGVRLEEHGFNPSAALVKACLVNSACEIHGDNSHYDDWGYPNNAQGWGAVDLREVLYCANHTNSRLWVADDDVIAQQGQEIEYTVDVYDGSAELEFTLVWTDPPGAIGATPAIVNNLDLVVTDPEGNTFLGNNFGGTVVHQSQVGGEADDLNVEETVLRLDPIPGQWTIEVRGTELVQGSQPFALVGTGDIVMDSAVCFVDDFDDNNIDDWEQLEIGGTIWTTNEPGYIHGDYNLAVDYDYYGVARATSRSIRCDFTRDYNIFLEYYQPEAYKYITVVDDGRVRVTQEAGIFYAHTLDGSRIEMISCALNVWNDIRVFVHPGGPSPYYQVEVNGIGCGPYSLLQSDNRRLSIGSLEDGGSRRSGEGFWDRIFVYGHPIANQPPTSSIVGPSSGLTGQLLSFDGSGSSDSDGTIVSFAWDFGDGATSTGMMASHAWSLWGTYVVSLTVTDNEGASDTEEKVVAIVEVPDAPQDLAAVASDIGAISLSWQAPSSNGGLQVISYNLYRSIDGSTFYLHATISATSGSVLPPTEYLDTGLSNGQTYYYMMTAVNAAGEGSFSNEASATTWDVPFAPQNLSFFYEDSYVELSWDCPASDGGSPITSWKIYRGTTSGGEVYLATVTCDGTMVPPPPSTYGDSEVVNGVAYYYQVSAVNEVGEGPRSSEIYVVPIAPPSPPQNLTAVPEIGSVFLTWLPPADDGGSQISSYRIYRGTLPGSEVLVHTMKPLAPEWRDYGVEAGATYYYQVSALNRAGESLLSNEASVTMATVPGAPAIRYAYAQLYAIEVGWDPPASDGGSLITNYRIYRSTDGSNFEYVGAVDSVTTNYIDVGLTEGIRYYYKVSAVNEVGEGPFSVKISMIPGAVADPPQDLQASADMISDSVCVILSWSASTDNGYAVTGYRVYRGTTLGEETYLSTTASTTYSDLSVAQGTIYYYKVAAANMWGDSDFSEVVSATTWDVPAAPQNFTSYASWEEGYPDPNEVWWYVRLSWFAPQYNGSPPVTSYDVFRGTVSGGETHLATIEDVLSYTDWEVTKGITYFYQVRAVNILGESSFSAEISQCVAVRPGPPIGVAVVGGVGQTTLTWLPPIFDGGTPITEYEIFKGTISGGESYAMSVSEDVRSYIDTAVSIGVTYYYAVRAVNIIGPGSLSIEVSATPTGYAPSSPMDLSGIYSDWLDCAFLYWDRPSSDGGSPVTEYRIYRAVKSGNVVRYSYLDSTTDLYYYDYDVQEGKRYYYYVTAVNAVDESAPSNEVSVKIPRP